MVCCESSEADLTPACKILKYNTYSENGGTTLYRTELLWQNNVITHRLNSGNILPSSAGGSLYGLISRDSITYNQNNLVDKIYYGRRGSAIEKYDLFYYNSNNPNPYKRETISTYANGYINTLVEDIVYENNKIKKTVGYLLEEGPLYNPTITDYTFDANGNLIQSVETSRQSIISDERIETIDYSNYDNHLNPFKNIEVPFVENRHLKYSTNNYRRIAETVSENNVIVSNYDWEITAYEYNPEGYPLFAEYLCH